MSGHLEARRTLRGAGSSAAVYPRLRPGPGSSRREVASHQRARIHAAMIECVSKRGYSALTVNEVVQCAGVSTRTFYEHFPDKDECFLATYELLARRSATRVREAQAGERHWQRRLQLAFAAWAAAIAHSPKAAWIEFDQVFAGGPAALERTRRAEAIFETMIAENFARAADDVLVPRLLVKGMVAGVHHVARARLLRGGTGELPCLADELLGWVLCLRSEALTALWRLPGCPAFALPTRQGAGFAGRGAEVDGASGGDRRRILDATAQLAADAGYWQLTVPEIRVAAGVPRKSFDAHFHGVRDCFMAALEHRYRRALARAYAAGAMGASWPGRIHRALYALCVCIASDPVFARVGFGEILASGLAGMRYRQRVIADVAGALWARTPPGLHPGELVGEASVAAVWEVIHRHVSHGLPGEPSRRLPLLAPMLSYLVLAPALGPERAVAAIAVEHERLCEQARRRGRPQRGRPLGDRAASASPMRAAPWR